MSEANPAPSQHASGPSRFRLFLDMLRRNWGLGDWLVLAAVGAVLVRVYQVRWETLRPWPILETDSAMLCTFAAALDKPANFAKDALLSDRGNFDFYATVQTPSARLWESLTGDYGVAFMVPQLPLVFFTLLGFYVLGRVLYRDRIAAFALAFSCLFQIKLKLLSTYWGISTWTTARDWFQAFLPFVLAGALHFRNRPKKWPWVMAATGLLIYCHPVSTPAWASAIWLGLWFCFPRDWSFRRRFVWMFGCGLVFLAVASPFVIKYLGAHESGATEVNVAMLRRIIRYRFLPAYSNVADSSFRLFKQLLQSGLVVVAILSALLVRTLEKGDRYKLNVVFAWAATLVLFATVIPIVEHSWAFENGRIPFEYDLIRNFRYLYAVAMLLAFWPLALVRRVSCEPATKRAVVVATGALLAAFALQYPMPAIAASHQDVAKSFYKKRIESPSKAGAKQKQTKEARAEQARVTKATRKLAKMDARNKAMLWVRKNTANSAAFLCNGRNDGLYLRYIGRRSVVFNWKDGGALIYASFKRLLDWYTWARRIRSIPRGASGLPTWAKHARKLKADHLFFSGRVAASQAAAVGAKVVYSNRHYTVMRLAPKK